jgi:hypothetical protein
MAKILARLTSKNIYLLRGVMNPQEKRNNMKKQNGGKLRDCSAVLFFARPDIIIYRNAKEIIIVTVSKTQYRV